MTEHKFTDEEVVKALWCCVLGDGGGCKKCAIYPFTLDMTADECMEIAMRYALDLINRQRAELGDLREIVYTDRSEAIKKIQSDAIKEYLATVLEKKDIAGHYLPGHCVVSVSVLEHYARIMTGEKNDG